MSPKNPDRRRAARRAAATGVAGLVGLSAAVAVPLVATDDTDSSAELLSEAPVAPTTTLSPAEQALVAYASSTPEQKAFIAWMSLTDEQRSYLTFVTASEEQRNFIVFVSSTDEERAALVNALAPPPAPKPRTAPRQQKQSEATVSGGGGSVWDSMAQCEAGGNWAANTGNGYSGGLQFAASTWRSHGGGEFAGAAHQATREQQIIVAERVLASSGWGAWPSCSRKLGLR